MLEALKTLSWSRRTYQIGLLQDKAYRALKQETTKHLKPLGLATTEWAFLGLLLDTGGISPTHAGIELGVETPFVTLMTKKLTKLGYVTEVKDTQDTRKKKLLLTLKGEHFVEKTEAHMRSTMRHVVDGVSKRALFDYLSVLLQIIKNSDKDN